MIPIKFFAGATVTVTGAGGSIGSEICRALVRFGAAEVRLVGHGEDSIYRIHKELATEYNRVNGADHWLAGRTRIKQIIASITDERAMREATRGADIVIHAAAHKHVPLCEQNPLEAIANNLGGTMTLATQASLNGVKQFVFISTDKAVKPISVMGRTKRACELMLQALQRGSDMNITTVRFGNVLDSAGSVLPLWREQLRAGKPITITDKRCTRFFMSIEQAAELALCAAALPDSRGTFVLDMGAPKNIYHMALDVIQKERPDIKPPETYMIETGLRPGEKLHEELVTGPTKQTEVAGVLRVEEPHNSEAMWVYRDVVMAARVGATQHALMALQEVCK